jgi:endonuclease/exonuclease/phosphatase family metal-dependent hydrolase
MVAVVWAGCGGDDDDDGVSFDAAPPPDSTGADDAAPPDGNGAPVLPETLPDPLPNGPLDLTIVTFNTGLIQAVKGADLRLPEIVSAIKARAAGVDVMCIQELYNEYESPEGMAEALKAEFPYAYWNPVGETVFKNGLLLLSKHPLYRGRVLYFENNNTPPFPDRALIAAMVVSDDWNLPVLCTHLQAGLAGTEDPAIRLAEVGEIDDFADAEGYLDGAALLLGDFNAGPDPDTTDFECDDPDTKGEVELCEPADLVAYQAVLDDGWTDPFPADAPCTSCRAQYIALELIAGLFADEPDQRIDHCWFRNLDPAVFIGGGVVFDEVQSIPFMDETLLTLSDHYGVECSFGPP